MRRSKWILLIIGIDFFSRFVSHVSLTCSLRDIAVLHFIYIDEERIALYILMFIFASGSVNKIFKSVLHIFEASYSYFHLTALQNQLRLGSFSSSLRPPRRRLLSQHKYRQPIRVNLLGLQVLITSPLVPIPLGFKPGYKTLSYWKWPAKILVLIEGPHIMETYIRGWRCFGRRWRKKVPAKYRHRSF